MSLFNQHWINFNGESVTGRTPPVTRIMNGVEMTEPQRAGVAHAYKLLTDALNVTPVKFLIQNRILPDGTKIRMVSNFGVDEVLVWPAGADAEEVAPFSGIGVCLATASGVAISDWLFTDDSGDHPQPYILTPGRKKQGGVFVSTGKWKRQAVSRLVGGQKLWVNQARKRWTSIFSYPEDQDPRATWAPTKSIQFYPSTIDPEWTAISSNRVNVYYSGDTPEFSKSVYSFALNDTVVLKSNSEPFPVFISKATYGGVEKEYACQLAPYQTTTTRGFDLHRGLYRPKLGLAEEDADLSVDGTYMDGALSIRIPITDANTRIGTTTLSVHPDGNKARLMSLVYSGNTFTGVTGSVVIDTKNPPTYTIEPDGVYVKNDTFNGSAVWSANSETSARPLRYWQFSSFCNEPSTDGEEILLTIFAPFADGDYGSLAETLTKSASGNLAVDLSQARMNRHYYAHNGDLVREVYSAKETGSAAFNYVGVRVKDAGDSGVEKVNTEVFDTYSVDATVAGSRNYEESINFGERTFKLTEETLVSQAAYTSRTGPVTVVASGTSTFIERKILLHDYVNDFIAYYELTRQCEFSGSKDFPSIANGGSSYDMSTLAAGQVTGRIVCEHKGVVVLSHDTVVPEAHTRKSAGAPNIAWGDSNLGRPDGSTIHNPTGRLSLISPFEFPGETTVTPIEKSYVYQGFAGEFCPPGTPAHGSGASRLVPGDDVTVPWTQFNQGQTSSGVRQTNYLTLILPTAATTLTGGSANNPGNYIHAALARDPVTLAMVVQISFKGSAVPLAANEDKEWLFAVDNTGAKELKDIFKSLPENATILRSAQINSLVSI